MEPGGDLPSQQESSFQYVERRRGERQPIEVRLEPVQRFVSGYLSAARNEHAATTRTRVTVDLPPVVDVGLQGD